MLWYVAQVHVMYSPLRNACHHLASEAHEVVWCVSALSLSVHLQLAFCIGEHQVAAASLPAAEGGAACGKRRWPRPQARPGALFGWLGPHASDRCFVQAAAGPLLPHYWGTDEDSASFSSILEHGFCYQFQMFVLRTENHENAPHNDIRQ